MMASVAVPPAITASNGFITAHLAGIVRKQHHYPTPPAHRAQGWRGCGTARGVLSGSLADLLGSRIKCDVCLTSTEPVRNHALHELKTLGPIEHQPMRAQFRVLHDLFFGHATSP